MTPASIIGLAPPGPSSAGWKTNTTVPARRAFSRSRTAAAPSAMAMWASWPQACMQPGWVEAKASPVSSAIGRASMSARIIRVGPGLPVRRSPTTPVPAIPLRTSRPIAASCAAT